MMQPRKNRTLLLLIAVLLLTNAVMLYLLNRPVPKEPELSRSERMVKMVQEELGLSEAQKAQYLQLRNQRDAMLKPHQLNLRGARQQMMNLLAKDSVPTDTLLAAAQAVGALQVPIELEYYYHFRRMQQMLEPAQQPKLDTLLRNMVLRGTGGADSLARTQPARSQ